MRPFMPLLLLASVLAASAKERVKAPAREPESPGEWQVAFAKTERSWKPGAEEAAREKTSSLSLRLGPAYFYLLDGDNLRLYDFTSGRVSRITAGERREDAPLLAEVQTREKELRREADQISLLARSGTPLPDAALALFLAESRAGITTSLEGFPGRMTTSGSAEKVWTVDGTLVAAWEKGDTAIPHAFAAMFERFLLYQLPLHPELRARIVAEGAPPRRMRYRERVGGLWRETVLELTSAEPRRDSLVPELKPTAAPDGTAHPLARVVAVATGQVDRGIRPTTPEEYGKQYRGLLEQGLYLESLLAILEFYLQSGADTEQPMTRLEPHAEDDAQLAAFLDAMAIATPDEAAASLGRLARVERGKLMRKHIYDVAAANAMLAVGRYREAEPLYLAALEHNPWLTGVYKKLGDLYAASERLPLAWTAYEAALRINGGHPMLKAVLAEGPRLMKAYPDFFLPQVGSGP